MNPNIAELLAEDISNRIGVQSQAYQNIHEALQRIEDGMDKPPCAELVYSMSTFLDPVTYEARLADGTVKQVPYDIDHIPTELTVEISVFAQTPQDTESLASSIRNTYSGNTDAGVFLLPIDDGTAHVAARYCADQIRSSVSGGDDISWSIINPADGIKMPMPYPYDDLGASLNDRAAILRLFITYFFYMHILTCDVPGRITNEYAKLFAAPNKIEGAKKGLFNKLRENQFASNILDSGIAQKLTGESITKLSDALQAGTLDKDEFDTYFGTVLPVVPDLYDRAMRYEPADAILAIVNAKISEVEQRAETIANSLGIERNPEGDEYYRPRSFDAAALYLAAFDLERNKDASASDIVETYRLYTESQAASAQEQQDLINNMVADKIDEMGSGSLLASLFSDSLRK